MKETEVQIPMFKPVTVFDISQTGGKPLPTLATDLTGNVQRLRLLHGVLCAAVPKCR